jgi:hypothetical protein
MGFCDRPQNQCGHGGEKKILFPGQESNFSRWAYSHLLASPPWFLITCVTHSHVASRQELKTPMTVVQDLSRGEACCAHMGHGNALWLRRLLAALRPEMKTQGGQTLWVSLRGWDTQVCCIRVFEMTDLGMKLEVTPEPYSQYWKMFQMKVVHYKEISELCDEPAFIRWSIFQKFEMSTSDLGVDRTGSIQIRQPPMWIP